MARWGKNFVVPLDSLIKEKENTNRPVAARSAGTVGKWGKMGFTSTRTYAFKALAAAAVASVNSADITDNVVAAAAALDIQNNSQSSSDPPKPKKFFKSRNASVDMIRTQIIQHLPRAPPSPIHETVSPTKKDPATTVKIKIPKPKPERKKSISDKGISKPKKKKEEKKLKPEAPPSRIISRQRKVVNYNEEDEDERSQTPLKDIITVPALSYTSRIISSKEEEKQNNQLNTSNESNTTEYDRENTENNVHEEEEPKSMDMEPPPITPSKQSNTEQHPPIVLRISKGISRLISTDSEEVINSPIQQTAVVEQQQQASAIASTEELLSVLSGEPVQQQVQQEQTQQQINEKNDEDQAETHIVKSVAEPEINTVESKVASENTTAEPQKYESLKIVIKTDALKNSFISDKPEKKVKNKKLKKIAATAVATLKTPSPKLSVDNRSPLMSPPPISEKDFDSQSSILGSISSKETTNQFAGVIAEDSCVIRSRGSSDVTSDLETSQHSSLVAPPSDIESRLESMMDCDEDLPPLEGTDSAAAFGGIENKLTPIQEEPLKEDILKVLTEGDTEKMEEEEKLSSKLEIEEKPLEITERTEKLSTPPPPNEEVTTRRMTRSRRGKLGISDSTNNNSTTAATIVEETPPPPPPVKSRRITRNNNGNIRNNSTAILPTRNYTRKRKNTQPPPPPAPPELEIQSEETSISQIDLPDAPSISIATNKKCDDINSETNEQSVEQIDETDNEIPLKTTKSDEKEYKIKNKFKRTWYERDAKRITGEDQESNSINDGPATKKFNNSSSISDNVNLEDTVQNNNNNNKNISTENGENGGCGGESSSSPSPLHHLITTNSSTVTDEEKPSVKLVISKKKGSIFKSRALISDQGGDNNSSKKRAIYKHTWDDDITAKDKEKSSTGNTPSAASDSGDTLFEDDFSNDTTAAKFSSRITRQNLLNTSGNNGNGNSGGISDKYDDNNIITKVKCDRKAKDYYTVVRNVKTAHQIQEIGEYQEMKDDVDYILDALQPHNPLSTRCLSALQLATKCMIPAFRMHLRAHATVGKFFKALKDAKNDLSLGLCTAAIMFSLSQDTLNIDLDRDSLELMINLLEIDTKKNSTTTTDSEENTIYERNKQKVRELCEEMKNQGKALHFNLDSISASTLAMETLLSLTSKKAGEWFKEELRELGGLEHIIKTICDCCYQITDYVVNWTEYLLDKLRTIERCLRVLENVSQQNETNQNYILLYNNGYALDTLFKLYKLCDSEIALYPTTDNTPKDNPGTVLRETLVPTLKVLINLTHPFDKSAYGSALLGQRSGIFDTSFHILLQAPNYVPERCIFELSILVLLLLINLTMYTIPNRTLIMKAHAPSDFGNQFDKIPAIKALIEYFYRCQEQALLAEQNTDEILENPESNKKKPQSQEEMDETVTKLLQKAGNHMEHTLQASYAGILIGHLISESSENEAVIRSYLRNNKFEDIISVLKKYYTFMDLTASSEATVVSHIKSTKNLIDYFVKCDTTIQHSNSNNDNDDNESNKNDNNHLYHQQLNNSSINNSSNDNNNSGNSGNNLDIHSPTSSSISTRSATRYYKSYSSNSSSQR